MEESGAADVGGGGGGGTAEKGLTAPKKKSALEVNGERLRFTVELRPGETTIVSWKKLVKDNNTTIPNGNIVQSAADSVPGQPHPSRLPTGPIAEKEGKDAQQANRFTTVIEKIERLYMGKGSSDEEDNNDVMPDDDEYDTEDSFIDDAELNEYFEVDNSAIKHSGFFVNRGKLERVGTSQLPSEQPKKRRRKDHVEGPDGNKSGDHPKKIAKVRKKTATSSPLVGKNALTGAPVTPLPNVPSEDARMKNQTSASESPSVRKKAADTKMSEQPLGSVNVDVISKERAVDQQKSGVLPANSHSNKVKEGSEHVGASNQISSNKTSHKHGEPRPEKLSTNLGGLENVQHKENASIRGMPEVSVPEGKISMQNERSPFSQKKEGSRSRQKSTLLEKAIRDLQKLVDESRPPTSEIPESDNSSQAIKRRLSPEIKQKLSKVARLAASQGKLSNELVNRLMSIVGHLIQLRSLKRNLKAMVNTGLSAKQEKDNKVQLVKKEVAEMIKARIPFIQTKDEAKAGSSDDFQDSSAGEKETSKRKSGMDDVLEDKICELYDLFVEGLEEDAGPQVRKLYAEISAFWPSGSMDNHGVKQAIGRAKERRKVLVSKRKAQDPEKIKRKKMMTQKGDESVRSEAITATAQTAVHTKEKSVVASTTTDHGLITSSVNKVLPSNTGSVSGPSSRIPPPAPLTNGSSPSGHPKHERIKGGASNSNSTTDSKVIDPTVKKKLKRKHENAAIQKSVMPASAAAGEVPFRN